MASSRRRDENIDLALGAATPVLDVLKEALCLTPFASFGLIPTALSRVVDAVKVREIVGPHPHTVRIFNDFANSLQRARANKESRSAFVDQVEALSAVIDGMVNKANATPASNGGRGDNRSKVADSIKNSQEFQEAARELLRYARGFYHASLTQTENNEARSKSSRRVSVS